MRETQAEMREEERLWRERKAKSAKYLSDCQNETESVTEVVVKHPKLYCGRCGGTADKPFDRLRPFREVKGGWVTTGWRCA